MTSQPSPPAPYRLLLDDQTALEVSSDRCPDGTGRITLDLRSGRYRAADLPELTRALYQHAGIADIAVVALPDLAEATTAFRNFGPVSAGRRNAGTTVEISADTGAVVSPAVAREIAGYLLAVADAADVGARVQAAKVGRLSAVIAEAIKGYRADTDHWIGANLAQNVADIAAKAAIVAGYAEATTP